MGGAGLGGMGGIPIVGVCPVVVLCPGREWRMSPRGWSAVVGLGAMKAGIGLTP